jgi:hypothetical protein
VSLAEARLPGDSSDSSTNARRLSKDVIFEVLKNRRRRDVLEYLQSTEGSVTLSELAERIAAWENDIPMSALNSTQRKRVYVALYQTHLPKMDDVGVIEYDSDRGTVELSENADLLRMYLTDDFRPEDPWYQRYMLLSLAGGGVLFVSQLGGVAALVSGAMLTLVVVAVFLVVSLFHMRDRRRVQRNLDELLDRIE